MEARKKWGAPAVNYTLEKFINHNYNIFLFIPSFIDGIELKNKINIFNCRIPFYNACFRNKILQGIKNKIDWLFINFIFSIKGILLRRKIKC